MVEEGTAEAVESHGGEYASLQRDLLARLEEWRLALAKNIALRNPLLRSGELDAAVHRTVAGILFLRICEDRGIGGRGTVRELLGRDGVAARLRDFWLHAGDSCAMDLLSEETGSGRPGAEAIPRPSIDDGVLEGILRQLCPPGDFPDLSLVPSAAIGQVYEIFLTKLIRLGGGHHARVEERPDVTRAGGFSGTPLFIVDYIVRHTLGDLVEGKSPKEVAGLRILDPACGAGLFLVTAYRFLLDWHLGWYRGHLVPLIGERGDVAAPGTGELLPVPGELPVTRIPGREPGQEHDGWILTAAERRRILLATLRGVDIDPRAVEVTRMLLFLETAGEGAWENCTEQSLLLRDLHGIIRCGNALIGPGFFRQGQVAPYNYREKRRVHPFDWDTEFTPAAGPGSFDAVIGSLPTGRQESGREVKEYYQAHYLVYHDTADLPMYFIEKGLSLLRPGGILSCTLPDSWLRTKSGGPLRRWLKGRGIREVLCFGDLPAFRNAPAKSCILTAMNGPPSEVFPVTKVDTPEFRDLDTYVRDHRYPVKTQDLTGGGWSLADVRAEALLGKVREAGTPLGSLTIPRENRYLLGLLGSRLARLFLRERRSRAPRGPLPPDKALFEDFPIYVPDFDDPADTARHDRMVALVTQMLDLHKRLHDTKLEHERTMIQRQIEVTDREIDNQVYELYGLTEEERRIVEEATGRKKTGA